MNNVRMLSFLGSRAASALGDQFLMFAVPLIVYHSTGSATMSGLAFLCEWLPRVISLPLAGTFSDRLGGRRVYALADGTRAGACLLAALGLAMWPGHSFAMAAILMAICAACYAQAFIALESTVPMLVPPEQMPKAQSILQAIDYSAGVLGPALAGALSLWLAPSQLLWAACGVFAVSAAGVCTLPPMPSRAAASQPSERRPLFLDSLQHGFATLRQAPVLLALVALSMLVNLVVGLALSTSAAVTVGVFGKTDQVYATLQAFMGMLSIASFLLVPWLLRRASVYQLGMAAFALIISGGVLMGLASHYSIFVLGYALSFGLCGLFNVFIRTERLHWIPKEKLGRVISVIVLLNQLSLPLSGLLVTLLANRIPLQWLFIGAALLAFGLWMPLQAYIRPRAVTAQPSLA
ncbi:MFS transporter [Chromobacterium vaccinii]|uniref:MFS transporter n=1 Tax=Chromobacterium vaccinii TaxID=1108595 RepID=UPI0032616FF1